MDTILPLTVIYLQPGDRVRCYDTFNGTVVRVVDEFLNRFAVVARDDGQGEVPVYAPHIRGIRAI